MGGAKKVDQLLEVGREGRVKAERLLGDGMGKGETRSVEGLAREVAQEVRPVVGSRTAIKSIPDQRASTIRKMDADLVRSPRMKAQLNQRRTN